jgi:hypothetical protein
VKTNLWCVEGLLFALGLATIVLGVVDIDGRTVEDKFEEDEWPTRLEGLSLDNISASVRPSMLPIAVPSLCGVTFLPVVRRTIHGSASDIGTWYRAYRRRTQPVTEDSFESDRVYSGYLDGSLDPGELVYSCSI